MVAVMNLLPEQLFQLKVARAWGNTLITGYLYSALVLEGGE